LHVPASFKLSPKIPHLFRTFAQNAFDIAFCFWPFALPAHPTPVIFVCPFVTLFVHILYRFGLLPLKTLHAHFLLFLLRVRCVFTFKSENTDSFHLSFSFSVSFSNSRSLTFSLHISYVSVCALINGKLSLIRNITYTQCWL